MVRTLGQQIVKARAQYGLSQRAVAGIIKRSQCWLSFVERGKFAIAEPLGNKILLTIHAAGIRAQEVANSDQELKDFRLPRSNARRPENRRHKGTRATSWRRRGAGGPQV